MRAQDAIRSKYTHRDSLRLHGYDYSQPGSYFITIVTKSRLPWFGHISAGKMKLNDAGTVVASEWQQLSIRFPQIWIDTFVVMSDHFHGIVTIVNHSAAHSISLGRVVQTFKSITTNAYILGVTHKGWRQFDRRLWHRNYYDRIIRDERELGHIREYIEANPLRWSIQN